MLKKHPTAHKPTTLREVIQEAPKPMDFYIVRYLEERPAPAVGWEIHETIVPDMEAFKILAEQLTAIGRKNISAKPGSYEK